MHPSAYNFAEMKVPQTPSQTTNYTAAAKEKKHHKKCRSKYHASNAQKCNQC